MFKVHPKIVIECIIIIFSFPFVRCIEQLVSIFILIPYKSFIPLFLIQNSNVLRVFVDDGLFNLTLKHEIHRYVELAFFRPILQTLIQDLRVPIEFTNSTENPFDVDVFLHYEDASMTDTAKTGRKCAQRRDTVHNILTSSGRRELVTPYS